MVFTEASTIQKSMIDWAEDAGWEHVPGVELPRDEHDVAIELWVREALLVLNPELGDDHESFDLVLHEIDHAILSARDGLVAANEALTVMLRGDHAFTTVDGQKVPRRLIDFENLEANKYVVAEEVTIKGSGHARRFDLVYYVNGFPLVVAETKTPVNQQVSWVNAAKDIHDVYEEEYPNFFTPNLFSIATDGLEFRMAPVRAVPDPDSEIWAPWGSTEDNPKIVTGPARVERAARLLLRPETVLPMLKDMAMYRHARDAGEVDFKLLPRYPQFEASVAIHDKVLAGRPGGLIWHHQGSGKTELMAFTAAVLLRDPKVVEKFGGAPTVVVVVDRTDLERQTADTFDTVGMPRLTVPATKRDLWSALRRKEPGVLITTVHKFKDAGLLSDRSNVVVLVDEAHRTQEGDLGKHMRRALPYSKFFGATGTAVQDKDRSTFKLFGDPGDPGFIMSRYTPEQSIADGFTKPVIVEGRSVGFDLSKEALDAAFDDLAEQEGLGGEEKAFLSGKASHIETILSNPERVATVCANIVDHFLTYVAPLGQKAQVVALNQRLVVMYADAIRAELAARSATMPDGQPREVGVVMHVLDAKDTPKELRRHLLKPEQEEALKRRFKRVDDPMSFIVVTAKWMTGFNAPIEGVLYLDKPAKGANLFQAITRPNRPWKNPVTGQLKDYGRVVDYIGLAGAIARAIVSPEGNDEGDAELNVTDASQLAAKFASDLTRLLSLFAGIDMTDPSFESLALAHERIPEGAAERTSFVETFIALQTVWEFLDPHPVLEGFKRQYLWLAKVYESVRPKDASKAFLWQRLGAKTTSLVHAHMSDVHVRALPSRNVTLDAAGLELLKQIAEKLRLPDKPTADTTPSDVYQSVLDSIKARLDRRLAEADERVYRSLAERIEKLRARVIESVADSLAFLEQALQIAQDVVAADRAAEVGNQAQLDRIVDPKIGALTQIVEQNTPEGLHKIIPDIVSRIDAIVADVAYSGWTESDKGDKDVRRELRGVLKSFSLPIKGALFDKIYIYVRENY